MGTISIILPYFGKFPEYFPQFLLSCGANPTIIWQLVTDQDRPRCIPDNVKYMRMSFVSCQKMIKSIFGAYPAEPYNLCQYRVAYWEIFPELVAGFDFWGYCDCDLIFGNLREFLTDEILSSYNKISWRGHLTLFRNTQKINSLYRIEIPGYKTFSGCISGSDGINLFDEVGINKIFDHEGCKIYKDLPFADLRIRSNNFICQHGLFDEATNRHQIFRWSPDLGLERIYIHANGLHSQKIAYVHFLKRPMEKRIEDRNEPYLIVPNRFIPDMPLDIKIVERFSKKNIYWSYYKKRIRPRFLFNKLREKLRHHNADADSYCR